MEEQERKKQAQERTVSAQDKIDFVLRTVLSPDAFEHLHQLKENEPRVYQAIFNELISPDVIQNLDYLIAIIQRRGGVPRKIPKDVIIFLERKIKGIKSKIRVQRKDEMLDLGSFLKKKD